MEIDFSLLLLEDTLELKNIGTKYVPCDSSVLLKVRTFYFVPKRLDCISLEDNFLSSMSSALLQVV